MISENWQIWLDDPFGNRLALLDDLAAMRLLKITNDVGQAELIVSPDYDHLIRQDCLLEFWRAPAGGVFKFVDAAFVRKIRLYQEADGMDLTLLSGPTANELLRTRIAAYAAASAYASKSGYADDMLKEIVAENLGASATDSGRQLPAAVFSVAPDTGSAAQTDKAFAWRPLLTVLQEIAEASWQSGTPLYFEMVPKVISDSRIGFEFVTYINQPGADRSGADRTVFGPEFGNLVDVSLEYDYVDENNVIYVGGQGLGDDRDVIEREDTDRSGVSIWNRREAFYNASGQVTTTAGLEAAGDVQLALGRPRLRFSGRLLDTEQTRYGRDWEHGDRVIVTYRGLQASSVIRSTEFVLGSSGEQIQARLEITAI